MKPTYSRHARLRMAQKRITEQEVESTISEYDIFYGDKNGNPIYVSHLGGRRIAVVISQSSDPPHVVTVWD